MEPVRTDPISGVLNFLQDLASGSAGPSDQITDKLDSGIVVDSCLPSDTHIWETGIERPDIEGKWVIVEQYPDKEHAIAGQAKWVKLMSEYPDFPLKDIDTWCLDELKDAADDGLG